MAKKKLYWICQISGWFLYAVLNLLFYALQNTVSFSDVWIFLVWFPLGIGITHLFRFVVIKTGIMKLTLYIQIPLVIIGSFFNAGLFFFLQSFIEQAVNIQPDEMILELFLSTLKNLFTIDIIANIINIAFVFFFWSLSYFSYHFLISFTESEMNSLRLQATMKETELNKIKSQLNPHFMFNSMNSIRALIDENPFKAKEAVTQLSNILRNTLMMEKNKLIPFDDEMKIVADYLNLEKIRFEERLDFKIDIPIEASKFAIPPLILQTLVENGIKHGVSKLTKGGQIIITAIIENNILKIYLRNSGTYNENNISETGFGLKNSIERLKYIFGDKASITISNDIENNMVLTNINIPYLKIN